MKDPDQEDKEWGIVFAILHVALGLLCLWIYLLFDDANLRARAAQRAEAASQTESVNPERPR